MNSNKRRYWEIDPLYEKYPNARYFFIVGGRSTGKTYPTIKRAIMDAIDGKGVFAYVRRYKDSISQFDMQTLFGKHSEWVSDYTDGEYNKVAYWQGGIYLERWSKDEETGEMFKEYKNPQPIGTVASISTWETKKGGDFGGLYGGMTYIILDEALSDGALYLSGEWKKFQNVVSSFVRDRWEDNTKIVLLANPVSKWRNPYFTNMGISTKMLREPGTTEISYPDKNGNPVMSTVFCYIAAVTNEKGEVVDIDPNRTNVYNKFFAFPNSEGTSKSIVMGFWELADAASLPEAYINDSVSKKKFFFKASEEDILQCEIMKFCQTNRYYIYFSHADEIPPEHWYFTLQPDLSHYAIIGFDTGHKLYKKFFEVYDTNAVFYEDNEIADAWHGFMHEANKYVA